MSEGVAVLGPKGTFTETAALKLYPEAKIEYANDVDSVFRFVDSGGGKGVVAIENSLEGSVGYNMECLMRYDVKITAEVVLDIVLCLIAKNRVRNEEIKVIFSHPHALGQCRRYLDKNYPNAIREARASTAEAILEASKRDDATAIGFKDTGLTYGLRIVAEGIQDEQSQTRFIALSRQASYGPKTSIIFATKNEPGALHSILGIFAEKNINLTNIESRPSRRKLGEYVFYVDFENNNMSADEMDALHRKIREKTTYLKNLGSY
ncbi:MAG: prephenate dehydratase [Candidatus Altiarchaeota archaeon]